MPLVQETADDILNGIFDLPERKFFYCCVNQHDSVLFFSRAQFLIKPVFVYPIGFPHEPADSVPVHRFFKFFPGHTHRNLNRVGCAGNNLQGQPYQTNRVFGKRTAFRKKQLNSFPATESFRLGKRKIGHR